MDLQVINCAPRVCGDDPAAYQFSSMMLIVLPAYAGMIPCTIIHWDTLLSAPRVCGDDPQYESMHHLVLLCSPRMRG